MAIAGSILSFILLGSSLSLVLCVMFQTVNDLYQSQKGQ